MSQTIQSQFHSFLASRNVDKALELCILKNLRSLDCSKWHIPLEEQNGFVSPFHAWISCWQKNAIAAKVLFWILKATKGVTRATSHTTIMKDGRQRNVLLFSLSELLTFVIDNAPDIIDLNASFLHSRNTILFDLIELYNDKTSDEFIAKCIKNATDDEVWGFNTLTEYGWSPLTRAVCNLRIRTVEALLMRIPMISIEPERESPHASSLKSLKPYLETFSRSDPDHGAHTIQLLIEKAKSKLEHYRNNLLECLLNCVPPNMPKDLCIVIQTYVDRGP